MKAQHLHDRADGVNPDLGKCKDPHQCKVGGRCIVDIRLVPMLVGEVQTNESQGSEDRERDGVVDRQGF